VIKPLLARVTNGQFVRYIIVGGWNTLFSYFVFAFFTYILTGVIPYAYMAATVISSIINITVAYLGYKRFVFKTKGNYLAEYLRCYVVYGSAAVASLILLPVLVYLLNFVIVQRVYVPYIAGAIVSLGAALVSFFGHRNFSFNCQPGRSLGPQPQSAGKDSGP
jgi:putative flippase GtrA